MEKLLTAIEKNPEKYLIKLSEKDLEKVLEAASDFYYNSEPILSDDTYDLLENELKMKNPESRYLNKIGAPVRKDIVKVELPAWMGSLDKIYPDTREFVNWFDKNKGPYFVTQKLDGASGLIVYDTEGEIKIYTRGDGKTGQDISFLKDHLRLPKIKKDITIRGEFMMKKNTFFQKYTKEFPKARTVVNSVINSKKPKKGILKDLDFVVYELIEDESKKFSDQFKILKKLGFNLPDYLISSKLSEPELRKLYLDWRQNSIYELDGLVITVDKDFIRYTDGNPKYSVAFKINLEGKKTEIEEVIWEVSKHGVIKPRVKFHPVILDGDVINYATAFNAKFIDENNLGKGSIIKIVKSGDVIPYILSVEKSTTADFPDMEYHWNDTHVDIVLDNPESSDDYKIKRILHFFQTLKIPNISIGIITKLYKYEFDTPKKICLMDLKDFLTLSGVKEKSGTKLLQSIKNIIDKPIPLERLMTASLAFENGFGEKRLKSIIDKYPKFMEVYSEIKIEDIEKIEGFSKKTSSSFVKNIKEFIDFMKDMDFLKIKKEERKGKKLEGLNFVFSGFRDSLLKEDIETQGGNVKETVTSKTTGLIIKKIEKNITGKVKKAKDLKIEIILEEEFKKRYNLGI